MKLAEVSIRRPVFAIMLSLALVTLGIFSYRTLGADLMPKTDCPQVNVRVSWPGASPEEIETQVAKPIEEAINTVNGIDELRMEARRGEVWGNISFVLERDMDAAIQDVRDKVAFIRFPRDVFPPQVFRWDPDSAPI